MVASQRLGESGPTFDQAPEKRCGDLPRLWTHGRRNAPERYSTVTLRGDLIELRL